MVERKWLVSGEIGMEEGGLEGNSGKRSEMIPGGNFLEMDEASDRREK